MPQVSGFVRNAVPNGLVLHTHHIKLIFTTSRDAGNRVRSIENYFSLIFPDSIKLNRGKSSLEAVMRTSQRLGANFLCLIESKMGNPSALKLFSLDNFELKYFFDIVGISLLSDRKERSPRYNYRGVCIDTVENECERVKWLMIDMGASILCNDASVKVKIYKKDDRCILRFNESESKTILSLTLR